MIKILYETSSLYKQLCRKNAMMISKSAAHDSSSLSAKNLHVIDLPVLPLSLMALVRSTKFQMSSNTRAKDTGFHNDDLSPVLIILPTINCSATEHNVFVS